MRDIVSKSQHYLATMQYRVTFRILRLVSRVIFRGSFMRSCQRWRKEHQTRMLLIPPEFLENAFFRIPNGTKVGFSWRPSSGKSMWIDSKTVGTGLRRELTERALRGTWNTRRKDVTRCTSEARKALRDMEYMVHNRMKLRPYVREATTISNRGRVVPVSGNLSPSIWANAQRIERLRQGKGVRGWRWSRNDVNF